jgi:hypothetical protein
MFRAASTKSNHGLFRAQWFYKYRQLYSAFCPQSAFVCSVRLSQQTATLSLKVDGTCRVVDRWLLGCFYGSNNDKRLLGQYTMSCS